MRRQRWFIPLAAAALAFSLMAVPSHAQSARPNILFILSDDQRWDQLANMPILQNQLVAKGVNFTNAFVVDPICCPSRASILKGQWPSQTGVFRNSYPGGGYGSFVPVPTIATQLQAAGYRTGLFGKYLNGYDYPSIIPPGWNRWFAFLYLDEQSNGYYNWSASDQGQEVFYGSQTSDYSTDVLTRKTIQFINSTPKSQPFFAYLAYRAPHGPTIPAPKYSTAFPNLSPWRPPSFNEADVSDKPAYIRGIAPMTTQQQQHEDNYRRKILQTMLSVDDGIGALLTTLQNRGQLANTLIVFMSDNGMLLGEHRWGGKAVPYNESLRVPLVVRYDAAGIRPRADAHIVLNVDLAPTWAAAAGTVMPGAEGQNLLPLLSNQASAWRSDFFFEHEREAVIPQPNRTPDYLPPSYCGIRSLSTMYVLYLDGEEELYNERTDPYELTNVATDPRYAGVLNDMRERLITLCDPPPPPGG